MGIKTKGLLVALLIGSMLVSIWAPILAMSDEESLTSIVISWIPFLIALILCGSLLRKEPNQAIYITSLIYLILFVLFFFYLFSEGLKIFGNGPLT